MWDFNLALDKPLQNAKAVQARDCELANALWDRRLTRQLLRDETEGLIKGNKK